MNDFPRRSRIDLLTPAEKAIYDAMQEVEEMAADERLTDAVCLLQDAQNKVADYVDGVENKHEYYHCAECGFNFVLANNASDNELKIFKSLDIFHMNPKLNIPCRNELSKINKAEFLRLFD